MNNIGKAGSENQLLLRGRPPVSTEKRTEMRQRIACAAERLFRTEGYGKISIRRIAKEIGCAPMTIYKYYDAKIDILRTLWDNVLITLFELLDHVTESSSAKEYLLDLGITYVDYWLRHPEYYRLVFMAEGVTQPEVSVFLDKPELIRKYGIFLIAIAKANPLKDSNGTLKPKFDFFLSTLHGIAHNHVTITGYGWSSPEEQIKYAVRAISNVH